MNRNEIYALVDQERRLQDKKWGAPRHHTPVEWISILGEEFGEAAQQANAVHFANDDDGLYRDELVQVIAVAVCILENLP